MARHTWRICLCNRKDTWCHHWPLGTRCNPPSPTGAVLPAWTWWSAIRGNGSTPGGAACNFSGQGFPDGRPGRVPAQACPQLGDSSQATCLARSVITVTQVRHGGGLVFFLPGHSGYDDVDYVAAGWHLIGVLPLLAVVVIVIVVIIATLWRCRPIPSSLGLLLPHLFVIHRNTRHRRPLEHVLRIVIVIVAFVVGARMHGGSSAAVYLGPAPSVPH